MVPEDDDEPEVVGRMEGLTGELCVHCGGRLCGHAALLAIVLGYANAPRCPRCFAEVLSTPAAELLREAHAHIKRRACFSRALAHADAREVGAGESDCIFGRASRAKAVAAPGADEPANGAELPQRLCPARPGTPGT